MALDAGEILIVNLGNGSYMVADRYALIERSTPDGYEQARDVSGQEWLDAIARASGAEPCRLPRPLADEDVLVCLADGRSVTRHKALAHQRMDAGWEDLDCVGTLDFLDALRAAGGLEPCDRAELGEGPEADANGPGM